MISKVLKCYIFSVSNSILYEEVSIEALDFSHSI